MAEPLRRSGPGRAARRARPGARRTITDAHVEQVVATTLEDTPAGATHGSTRQLATQLGMSQSAVSRIWRAFGLEPDKREAFNLSRDPQFIDEVRDVVGLYLDPPDRALVLSVDEKPHIQATEGTTPVLPMRPVSRSNTRATTSGTARATSSPRWT